jgi:hypothetical protein
MLEDVYVAKRRHRNGEPYGFIKFYNVRDVTKMMKALNVVFFGQFHVRASVAKFERNDSRAVRRSGEVQSGLSKGGDDSLKKDGVQISTMQVAIKGGRVLRYPPVIFFVEITPLSCCRIFF